MEKTKVVILGGTGLIGTKLGAALRQAGHEVLPASPSTGVNAITGDGLTEALKGADVLVDVSNSPSFADEPVMHFFRTSTTNVLRAAAGIGHYVALSVVGADRLHQSGYMRAKLVQEQLIRDSGLPYTILRATQFYEFVGAIVDAAADGNTVRLSPRSFQPIAAEDVARELATIAAQPALNGIVDLGGPERAPLATFGQRWLRAKGHPREVISDDTALYFGQLLDDESLVPLGPDARSGSLRFEDWLKL